jgi:molybdopterin molybdotransferase
VLKPQDLGVLASIGCLEPWVRRRPRVAVAVTGNELALPGPPGSLAPFSVVNSNAPVIEALVGELGGDAIPLGIVRDDPEAMRGLVKDFPGDLLVTTGGTSVGLEDYLPLVLAELGELVVHGIGIRPGYPSGFGRVGERLVFLLPGNPVAAMVGFDVLVRPALQWMLGQEEGRRNPRAHGRLTRKVASALNRVDFVRVEVRGSDVTPLGSGGAGVLSSMTRADGFVIVPRDLEGLEPGAEVEVYLL